MSASLRRNLRASVVNFVVAAVVIVVVTGVGKGRAVAGEQPDKFVQELGDKVIDVMRKNGSAPVRREEFRKLLVENFDLHKVSSAALGRYSHRVSDEQLERYRVIYVDYVLAIYGGLFAKYAGETLTVTDTTPVPDGDVLVNSRINQPNGPPTVLAFRVRRSDDGFKVLDVLVEGISMLVTQRSEFASVIGREGIDGFLDRMQEVAEQNTPE